MKRIALGLVALGLACSATFVAAQDCNSAITSTISTSPTTLDMQNSCQQASTLVNACQNQDPMNGAGVAIYALTVGTNNTGVMVSVTSADFAPYVALIKPNAQNCNSIGPCVFDPQAGDVGTISGTLPDASTAGTYWIVVGDTGADSPGCGTFSLAVTGTLPVKLQNFSVD